MSKLKLLPMLSSVIVVSLACCIFMKGSSASEVILNVVSFTESKAVVSVEPAAPRFTVKPVDATTAVSTASVTKAAESTEAIQITESAVMSDSGIEHPVAASWFDDAVFVGDSVTLKLSYYASANPYELGNAEFFCAGSLGYANAQMDINAPNAVHPYYKGNVQLVENCAAVTGAKKVFIMLGMNDVGIYGADGALYNADIILSRIHSNSPDAQIYVQSVTPILYGHEIGTLSNETIREFNSLLLQYCSVHGYRFIDVYDKMRDETGCLKWEYCSDSSGQGIHFTDEACAVWVDCLKNNV